MAEISRVCEVCGKLATHVVQDLTRHNNYDLLVQEYEPIGPLHAFCAEHARESLTADVSVSPLAYYADKEAEERKRDDQ